MHSKRGANAPAHAPAHAPASAYTTTTILDSKKEDPLLPPLLKNQPEQKNAKPRKPKSFATTLPDDWEPNAKHFEKCAQLGHDCLALAEQFKARNLATGGRYENWDAAFRYWIGNAAKFGGNGAKNGSGAGFAGRPEPQGVVAAALRVAARREAKNKEDLRGTGGI